MVARAAASLILLLQLGVAGAAAQSPSVPQGVGAPQNTPAGTTSPAPLPPLAASVPGKDEATPVAATAPASTGYSPPQDFETGYSLPQDDEDDNGSEPHDDDAGDDDNAPPH